MAALQARRPRASVSRSCSSRSRTAREWTRRSSFAVCRPKISTRRRRRASPPSAIRAPRWARRLASSSVELGEELVGRGERVLAEPALDRGEPPPVRLVGVLLRRHVVDRADARIGAGELGRHAPGARELAHVAPRRSRARGGGRPRARPRPSRGPVCGFPSRSPPIQLPKRSGAGAPGTSARSSASRRGAASQRLCSTNQRPLRISSTTRGRCERTSSVCQRIVISSARSARTRSSADGGRSGTSSSCSSAAIRRCLAEHGAAGGLGRVRGQDELDREPPGRGAQLVRAERRRARARRARRGATRAERGPRARTRAGGAGGGAARRCWRAGSRARRRAGRAPAARGRGRDVAAVSVFGAAASPCRGRARERAEPLLQLEQLTPLLLDEHAAERVPEQADVRAQRRVGGTHAASPTRPSHLRLASVTLSPRCLTP